MLPPCQVPLELGSATAAKDNSLVVVRSLPELGFTGIARSMGGFCGDHAAALAMETVASFALGTIAKAELRRVFAFGEPLLRAIVLANERVYATQFVEREQQRDLCRGHGCSLATIRVTSDHVVIANIGDCRAYRFRASAEQAGLDLGLLRITTDKTVANLGEAPEDVAIGRVVLGWAGMESSSFADAHLVAHMPGDVFVLASDGLHQALPRPALRDVLSRATAETCATIARRIVDACPSLTDDALRTTGAVVLRIGASHPEVAAATPEELAMIAPVFQEAYRPIPGVQEGERWVVRALWGASIAGAAALERHGHDGLVMDVLVTSAWRNRDVDVALLAEARAIARRAHLGRVFLRSAPSSVDRYAAIGFKLASDVPGSINAVKGPHDKVLWCLAEHGE